MKKLLLFGLLCWITAPALAQPLENFYIQAGSGLSKLQQSSFYDPNPTDVATSFKASRTIKVAMGRKVGRGWRTEISIDNVSNSMKHTLPFFADDPEFEYSVREKLTSLLANAYYDLSLSRKWFAFAGAGAGPARLKIYSNVVYKNTAGSDSFSSEVIAYHGSAGLGFKVTESLWLTSTYHHLASTPLKSELSIDGNPFAHRPHHRSDAGYLEMTYFF